MKKLFSSRKWRWGIMSLVAVAFASCYVLKTIEMPHAVAPGEEFTVKATIVGNDNNNHAGGYAHFGIRVPEDWEVSVPDNVLEHYTADGVLDATFTGTPNEIMTEMFNYRYPVEGYKWVAFSTGVDGDEKHNFGFDGNDYDYYIVNIKVKAGDTEGDYMLDFIFGDETDKYEKYTSDLSHNPNQDPRLCETGTFAADPTMENAVNDNGQSKPSIHNVVELNTSINVSRDNGGVESVAADAFEITGCAGGIRVTATGAEAMNAIVTVYNAAGLQLDMKALTQGETMLEAQKGICIVEVLKGNHKTVRKVYVR